VHRNTAVLAVLAGVSLLVAVAFLGLWRIAAGSQNHAYDSGPMPPTTVALTAGKTYQLSTVDGPEQLSDRGALEQPAACTWSTAGEAPQALAVTPVTADSRSTHVVATFVGPAGGDVHIECPAWGAVWVDDSDDAPTDLAGLFLVVAVITLTSGVIFALTAVYRRSIAPVGRHARDEDEEIVTDVEWESDLPPSGAPAADRYRDP
jgi:hypothetical protein